MSFLCCLLLSTHVSADGMDLAKCLNKTNEHEEQPSLAEWKGTHANIVPVPDHKDLYYLFNRLGRHVTWTLILDTAVSPPKAYGTYHHKALAVKLFGQQEVPKSVLRSLSGCAVHFAGLWPKAIPGSEKVSTQPLTEEHKSIDHSNVLEELNNLLPKSD